METWAMRQFPWWGKTLLGHRKTFIHRPFLSLSSHPRAELVITSLSSWWMGLLTESRWRWCKFSQAGDKEAGECLMCGHLKIITGEKSRENSCDSHPRWSPASNCLQIIITCPTHQSITPFIVIYVRRNFVRSVHFQRSVPSNSDLTFANIINIHQRIKGNLEYQQAFQVLVVWIWLIVRIDKNFSNIFAPYTQYYETQGLCSRTVVLESKDGKPRSQLALDKSELWHTLILGDRSKSGTEFAANMWQV